MESLETQKTETTNADLKLMEKKAYEELRKLRGKVKFAMTWKQLRDKE